jgi:hypothetical protein
MRRTALVGLTVLGCVLTACGEAPMMAPAGAGYAQAPATKARSLSLVKTNSSQQKVLDQFSRAEGRPVALKKDAFGHGVLSPVLATTESAMLKTLEGDRRSVEENGAKTLPGGLRQKAATHFKFFYPKQASQPRIVPLYSAKSRELLGFRAEVELGGANPEEGSDLYFAYYDRTGKLLAANG